MKLISLDQSDEEIKSMTKKTLKGILKTKVSKAAFREMLMQKQDKSKMVDMKYHKMEMASYLQSPMFNQEQASLLLALRTRTVRGVRTDFGDMFMDKLCPLQCGDQYTLENILKYEVLKYDISEENDTLSSRISTRRIWSSRRLPLPCSQSC